VERTSRDGASRLLLLANFAGEAMEATLPSDLRDANWTDALDGSSFKEAKTVRVAPFGFRWLVD
jgi:hypothetical protein